MKHIYITLLLCFGTYFSTGTVGDETPSTYGLYTYQALTPEESELARKYYAAEDTIKKSDYEKFAEIIQAEPNVVKSFPHDGLLDWALHRRKWLGDKATSFIQAIMPHLQILTNENEERCEAIIAEYLNINCSDESFKEGLSLINTLLVSARKDLTIVDIDCCPTEKTLPGTLYKFTKNWIPAINDQRNVWGTVYKLLRPNANYDIDEAVSQLLSANPKFVSRCKSARDIELSDEQFEILFDKLHKRARDLYLAKIKPRRKEIMAIMKNARPPINTTEFPKLEPTSSAACSSSSAAYSNNQN